MDIFHQIRAHCRLDDVRSSIVVPVIFLLTQVNFVISNTSTMQPLLYSELGPAENSASEVEKEEEPSPEIDMLGTHSNAAELLLNLAATPNQSVEISIRKRRAKPSLSILDDKRPKPTVSVERKAVKSKTAAFIGVRRRQWGTYAAEIRNQHSGAREWLGTYQTQEEAAVVYDTRLRQLKGTKAKCNFPPLDCSGNMVIRLIYPHGKSGNDTLQLLIPGDWQKQVEAFKSQQDGVKPPAIAVKELLPAQQQHVMTLMPPPPLDLIPRGIQKNASNFTIV